MSSSHFGPRLCRIGRRARPKLLLRSCCRYFLHDLFGLMKSVLEMHIRLTRCLPCVKHLVEVEGVDVFEASRTCRYTALDFAEWEVTQQTSPSAKGLTCGTRAPRP